MTTHLQLWFLSLCLYHCSGTKHHGGRNRQAFRLSIYWNLAEIPWDQGRRTSGILSRRAWTPLTSNLAPARPPMFEDCSETFARKVSKWHEGHAVYAASCSLALPPLPWSFEGSLALNLNQKQQTNGKCLHRQTPTNIIYDNVYM